MKTILHSAAAALACAVAFGAHAEVSVRDAWVRGTVPGQSATGAYMTLKSTEDAKLVGVATPAAKHAEIHSNEMKDGVMRMRPAGPVALPAGRDVALQGDLHVMLMGLAKPLGASDRVRFELTVEDAKGRRRTVEVEAPVRPLGR
jgi:copper(I)-binding protein